MFRAKGSVGAHMGPEAMPQAAHACLELGLQGAVSAQHALNSHVPSGHYVQRWAQRLALGPIVLRVQGFQALSVRSMRLRAVMPLNAGLECSPE